MWSQFKSSSAQLPGSMLLVNKQMLFAVLKINQVETWLKQFAFFHCTTTLSTASGHLSPCILYHLPLTMTPPTTANATSRKRTSAQDPTAASGRGNKAAKQARARDAPTSRVAEGGCSPFFFSQFLILRISRISKQNHYRSRRGQR